MEMHNFKAFRFGRGSHLTRSEGMCLMEAVAYLAGEPHGDRPDCASSVITDIAIELNDLCDDDLRQTLLADMPWRIVGTADPSRESDRVFMLMDWLVNWLLKTRDQSAYIHIADAKQITDVGSARHIKNQMRGLSEKSAMVFFAVTLAACGEHDDATDAARFAIAAYSDDAVLRSLAELLDRMIRLTEPQERRVVVSANQTA